MIQYVYPKRCALNIFNMQMVVSSTCIILLVVAKSVSHTSGAKELNIYMNIYAY